MNLLRQDIFFTLAPEKPWTVFWCRFDSARVKRDLMSIIKKVYTHRCLFFLLLYLMFYPVLFDRYYSPTGSKKTTTKYPGNIYLFKVNNRKTRKRCEICSKSTIKTLRKVWSMFKVNKKDTKKRCGICSKLTTKTLKKVWNVFKVNNKNTRKRCECSKLTIKILEKGVKYVQS